LTHNSLFLYINGYGHRSGDFTKEQYVWTNRNILHSSQHEFRWGKGTDTALLRIIDALEDARVFGTEARMTLWDLRRAFDSVSRNFLRLSWTRLGVPADTATWLTGLDKGGSTYVSSPHLSYSITLNPDPLRKYYRKMNTSLRTRTKASMLSAALAKKMAPVLYAGL
jgi:hypothetical protein